MLLLALVVFFIFSLACALAKTMTQLIVFRALQGVGGGSIMTIAMIMSVFPISATELSSLMILPLARTISYPFSSVANTRASSKSSLSFLMDRALSSAVHSRSTPPGDGRSGSTSHSVR
jgi:MFS family permease